MQPVFRGEHVTLTQVNGLHEGLSERADKITRALGQDPELARVSGAVWGSFESTYSTPEDVAQRLLQVHPDDITIYQVDDHAGFVGIAERYPNAAWGPVAEGQDLPEARRVKQGLLRIFVPRGTADFMLNVPEAIAGLRELSGNPAQANAIESNLVSPNILAAYTQAEMPLKQIGSFAVKQLNFEEEEGRNPIIVHQKLTFEATPPAGQ